MPPPGYEPFLHAICADPADDTVRLVYADWLDENGDPDRAEFIRLQIAQAANPERADPQDARIRELVTRNFVRWAREVPTFPTSYRPLVFERGFQSHGDISATGAFVDEFSQLCRAVPIQHLILSDFTPERVAAVLELPEIERMRSLNLRRCKFRTDDWSLLARAPRLRKLTDLALNPVFGPETEMSDADAQAFAESPFLSALQKLFVGSGATPTAQQVLRARFPAVRFRPVYEDEPDDESGES